MPQALYTQNVVAFIWDFDKTLTHTYMQDPLFEEYEVDGKEFWKEVHGLVNYYHKRHREDELQVSKDTAYLGHILSYVSSGVFKDLTIKKLRELGARIKLAPGMPEFMRRTHEVVRSDERFGRHEIKVEHYVVSTGLRQMILGSAIAEAVNGVWACELLPDPPGRGYLKEGKAAETGLLSHPCRSGAVSTTEVGRFVTGLGRCPARCG